MIKQEFQDRYPGLYRCLKEMALDNGNTFNQQFDLEKGIWSPDWGGLAHLEELARPLSQDEIGLMAAGEQSEREEFVKERNLKALDDFLADAFEGSLAKVFYV